MSEKTGPLVVPWRPRNPVVARAMLRLKGAPTSTTWLPGDSGWPELDEIREEQLRVRGQIADGLAEVAALYAGYREEDATHTRELIEAQRNGGRAVEDRRTPDELREIEGAKLKDRVEAGLMVMAEIVDKLIDTVREHEETWLGDLRSSLSDAEEGRREAERLAHEARVNEYGVAKLGDWLKKTADDGPFGMQPHPDPQDPPRTWGPGMARAMLERRYYEQDNMVSHQQSSGVTNEDLASPFDDELEGEEPVPSKTRLEGPAPQRTHADAMQMQTCRRR